MKKFGPAQNKDESFLVTAALNQKHNNSNRYKNNKMRATDTTQGGWQKNPFFSEAQAVFPLGPLPFLSVCLYAPADILTIS